MVSKLAAAEATGGSKPPGSGARWKNELTHRLMQDFGETRRYRELNAIEKISAKP